MQEASCNGGGRHVESCNCWVGGTHKGVTESLEEMDFQRSLAGAAQVGDVTRMRGLIERGAPVNGDGDAGYSPLHYAARHGHVQACLLLLQKGALVNRRTRAGQATSLHRAAYAGHAEIVKLLLHTGADVRAQDTDGQTPLHKAVMQGHKNVAVLLVDACPDARTISDKQIYGCAFLRGVILGDHYGLPQCFTRCGRVDVQMHEGFNGDFQKLVPICTE